ncbi:MAG: topoisomerase I, DNA topoisomerase I protein [Microgenomates group bacterium GW2011_GWC1_38_14]|nr:MAG: topoisomerase I, DNA topoisomerase I protein [Microgenomates group bacterium GW2011_GWC1_38_14]
MKSLVIVESPTKARTIGRFLGSDYTILASMGHIKDLPKSKLGVDIEKNFEPQYELMPSKKRSIAEIKREGKNADRIILATDLDREGEAIAAHIAEILGKGKYERIVFHEITKEAIEEALNNPRKIDENLVDAQTARRVLDRLVGYKLSPVLWQKVRRGLSAGRVQSVALRLIVEREREIEKFKKEHYWTIVVSLKKGEVETPFELFEIKGEKIEISEKLKLYDGEYKFAKTVIDSEKRAKEIEDNLKTKEFVVSDVAKKESKRTPPPPYTTSTLQQDGARRMGLSGKRTMQLAQKLYEEGFITYHRTDSFSISDGARRQMTAFVKAEYGDKYLPDKPRFYKNSSKNAQEAHESIRPTKESTTVMVDVSKGNYTLKTNGSVLLFEGFLKINPWALEDKRLPEFKSAEKLNFVSASLEFHETLPPPRYNDASIIKSLEEEGIGRPSTYATIISVIEERGYVERLEARIVPTAVGFAVNDFLVANFSEVDDIPFTASMEDELDEVAQGKKKWEPVIKEFYTPFEEDLEKVQKAERVKIAVEETGETCPLCKKGKVVIRSGRFGKFKSCSTFPECKYTAPLVEETNLICPKDGGKIVIKKTRRGRKFYGCSNYPKCDFAAWKLEDIKQAKEQ